MPFFPFANRCIQKIGALIRAIGEKVVHACDIRRADYLCKQRVKKSGGYRGTREEYLNVVLSYWKRYGVRPKRCWYALYCNGMEQYDPRFIPNTIWKHDILPYFNCLEVRSAYDDKALYKKLLKDVQQPETIVKCVGGYFINGDGECLISKEQAESLCQQEEHLICKQSMGRRGEGIMFYDGDRIDGPSLIDIFKAMGNNFVVQRIVKQHPNLERLNPGSLNTIRVMSFHYKGEIHILSAQLRIGGVGSRVDNVSAGGSACAIKPDGWLQEKSVTRKSTWTDKTPNGIKLNTIQVPNYDGIITTIKRLHCQLPYFNIIGWDFAVGLDGTPIMIEFNIKPSQNQIGGKEPTFGALTEEVLDDVYIKKSLKNVFKF